MKSVLISIKPKWVEKIASGEKTIEVRKTIPKKGTPFKCYIYCTRSKNKLFWLDEEIKDTDGLPKGLKACYSRIGNGSVIGEFVCDKIDNYECELWNDEAYELIRQFNYDEYGEIEYEHGAENNENCEMLNKACLTWQGIRKYLGQGLNNCYAWHISDLKIYDKPKELSEFWTIKCTNKRNGCQGCKVKPNCIKTITRPFQSWGYVESLGEKYGKRKSERD